MKRSSPGDRIPAGYGVYDVIGSVWDWRVAGVNSLSANVQPKVTARSSILRSHVGWKRWL